MMEPLTKVIQEGQDLDFIWGDYLEATTSTAAPPTAFSHVEYSLESGFKIGMKLEVVNPEIKDHYWIASVVMTCGPLLSLRYIGYGEDRSADFWFNIKTSEFHPVGWCKQNNKILYPPRGVREKYKDYKYLLTKELEAHSVPLSLAQDLESGITPIDQIKCGMKLEVLDDLNPLCAWPVTIIQNVGGRLLLRYDGCPVSGEDDFWLFYLSPRIHTIGWGLRHSLSYYPPKEKLITNLEKSWKEMLASSFDSAKSVIFPSHILEPQISVEHHGFKEGMKLEALNPETLLDLCPATVIKIINEYYFLIKIDCFEAEEKKKHIVSCCHSNSSTIFPCKWAEENEVALTPPSGYKSEEKFCWDQYLLQCNAIAAPGNLFGMNFMNMGFETGMKLEAVNPFSPSQICVSTIQRIVEPLIWIEIDNADSPNCTYITTVNSLDIFPVGWCDSNGYLLQTPALTKCCKRNNCKDSRCIDQKDAQLSVDIKDYTEHPHSKAWCPKIYFNHRCFSGPLLSKSRLAELPQAIGPGPVDLVMKDVLTRLINIAYKSSRVLRELQISGKPDPNMYQQTVKAKYKGKSYRATVEFVRNSEQIEEFCRKICLKLDCCPYLFGPRHVGKECPENCHTLTKTKFGNNFMKKSKKTYNPLVLSGSEDVKRGPGRRKKKKHWRTVMANDKLMTEKACSRETSNQASDESSPDTSTCFDHNRTESGISIKKKWKIQHSKVVTRGAKLPNFGSEKKWSFLSSKVNRRPLVRKVGRPLGSTSKKIATLARNRAFLHRAAAMHRNTTSGNYKVMKTESFAKLRSNPLDWTVDDVVNFVKDTECAPIASLLRQQEIDGQSLLMLTLYSVQEFLHLKFEPAKIFCTLIEKLKLQFLRQFT